MTTATWILESGVFPISHDRLRNAIVDAGHLIVDWQDHWWHTGLPEFVSDTPILFHGSLGNAARVESETKWSPGSICNVGAFSCTSWYDLVWPWLLNKNWRCLPANKLVENPRQIARDLHCEDQFFVRPDSPLKPFSGRVVDVASLSLGSLDHGFYYDDETLPVVVAPVAEVEREWRFIVVEGQVVAGSRYEAANRSASTAAGMRDARKQAEKMARSILVSFPVYVLDVCFVGGEYRLLELNPFGGADLYDCDAAAIVEAVSDFAIRRHQS